MKIRLSKNDVSDFQEILSFEFSWDVFYKSLTLNYRETVIFLMFLIVMSLVFSGGSVKNYVSHCCLDHEPRPLAWNRSPSQDCLKLLKSSKCEVSNIRTFRIQNANYNDEFDRVSSFKNDDLMFYLSLV